MKGLSKIVLLSALVSLGLSACGMAPASTVEPSSEEPVSSEEFMSIEENSIPEDLSRAELYVKKVENISDSFYRGMDISSVISLEQSGVKFYNYDGEEEDLLKILADNGVNLIRVRIWNDPYDANGNGYGGGNNDIAKAVEIGKRATKYGMKLLANFHYSDSWADPGRQLVPKAWKNMDLATKAQALYDYTVDCMNQFKNNNIDVGLVQVGNETNGYSLAGEKTLEAFVTLVNKGYDAVKSVMPDCPVAIHFTNPERKGYLGIGGDLNSQGCKYDIFGSSYYPFYHGTLDNLVSQLNKVVDYGKKVMVLETSYAYTDEDTDFTGNSFSSTSNFPQDYPVSPAGQANNFRNICDALVNRVKNNAGIGVCYWEGAWLTVGTNSWAENEQKWSQYGSGWSSKYAAEYDPEAPKQYSAGTVVDNQAFFRADGTPTEALKVFKYLKEGHDAPIYLDGVEKTSVTFMANENIVLPAGVNGILNSDQRGLLPVVWENVDIDALKDKAPASFQINGTVTHSGKEYSTVCDLVLKVANYALNGEFESALAPWSLVNNNPNDNTYQHLWATSNNNVHSGKGSIHTWSNSPDTINFDVVQEVTMEKDLTLKLRYFIMGGGGNSSADADRSKMNIYGYVREKGSETNLVKVDGFVNRWAAAGDAGEYGWQQFTSDPVQVENGKTYVVGIHIESGEAGFWADLDDVSFFE